MTAGPYSIGSDNWPGLSKVIEESGELGQVIGKIIALGGGTEHWDGTDLRVRFREEASDVIAALFFMEDVSGGIIDHGRVEAKRVLFHRWQAEQGAARDGVEADLRREVHRMQAMLAEHEARLPEHRRDCPSLHNCSRDHPGADVYHPPQACTCPHLSPTTHPKD